MTEANKTSNPKPGKPDDLIKGDKSKAELTEDELKKVSGGLKIDLKVDHK